MRTLYTIMPLLLWTMVLAQPELPGSEQWYNFTDDGHQQYVYEFGNAASPGDTVVVLHGGWGADHSYLIDPLVPLADRYRFVLYDQRGSLRSPAPDSTLKLSRLVEDLEDLRQALRLEQFTLAAHSMGNGLAYAYLDRYPGRVRGLVLMAPVLPAQLTDGPNMDFIKQVWPEADSTALYLDLMSFMEGLAARTVERIRQEGLIPDSLEHLPPHELELLSVLEDREWTRAWRIGFATANSCDNSGWRDMQGGMIHYSQRAANAIIGDSAYLAHTDRFWPALSQFSGPVRVIIGTCDYVDIGPSVWPHVVKHLPDAKVHVVQDAGHSIWMDKPKEFRETLDAGCGGAGGSEERTCLRWIEEGGTGHYMMSIICMDLIRLTDNFSAPRSVYGIWNGRNRIRNPLDRHVRPRGSTIWKPRCGTSTISACARPPGFRATTSET